MNHLYEYTEDMERLMESDEEVSETALAEIFGDIQKKSENICHFLADLDADAAKFKAEEERLSARRKTIESRSKQLKEYLKYNMVRLGLTKLDAGTFTVTVSPTKGSLEITDVNRIPAEYKTVEVVTTINKNAVKAAIDNGADIEGARIVPGHSLRIR